jgi:hypothetical protein
LIDTERIHLMVITALALFDITAGERSLARSALPTAPVRRVPSKRR